MRFITSLLILFLASPIFSQTTYTQQQILNKVFLPADGVLKGETAHTGQNILNMVFDSDSNALKMNVSTTAAKFVLKAGDTMTGPLTLSGSTLTVQGNAFSVGISTLVVKGGLIGIGTTTPADKVDIASGTIRMAGSGAPTIGGALCLNTSGAMAKCTSTIDASGNCTCP